MRLNSRREEKRSKLFEKTQPGDLKGEEDDEAHELPEKK